MDFSAIFQIRTKGSWLTNVIFYFVISGLVATVFCYLIFFAKNSFQREDIKTETSALQTVGTDTQKSQEQTVIKYQKEVSDFNSIFKNHEFASNVFAFMQTQTMPNIWFKQFGLDEKGDSVQLSGESDDMDALSRQVAIFEKNKYVTNVDALNSSLGDNTRIEFSINLSLDQNIFSYLSDMSAVLQTTTALTQPTVQPGQTTSTTPATPTTPANNSPTPAQTGTATAQPTTGQKLITSFHLLLNPEVIGVVDETNFTVKLSVPYGTDVTNLKPSLVVSPGATVLPSPDVPQDFTGPVTYTIIAQDGSAQTYNVSVTIVPPLVVAKKSAGSKVNIFVIIITAVLVISIAGAALFIWLKMRKQKPKF